MNKSEDITSENTGLTEKQYFKKKRPPFRLALFLFLLTGLTTLLAGYSLHTAFLLQAGEILSQPHWTGLLRNPSLILQGLPFSVEVPNEITRKTFEATDRGEDLNAYDSLDKMFEALDIC